MSKAGDDLKAKLLAAGLDEAKAREIVAIEEGGGGCCAEPGDLPVRRAAAVEAAEAQDTAGLAVGLAALGWADRDAELLYLDPEDRAALADGKKRGNWVSQAGGLPKLIRRVADHLMEKGMTESHAIATAVNVVKKYCSRGDLNFPGKQNVTAATKAKGCAAVAEWNAKRAKARAT